ncbi:MAG: hypothetical protein M1826_005843 [Phylliscum demangeonii]|nr:MAG: hypothetical protein M1826_005843 [Phylliscum demangeonii]
MTTHAEAPAILPLGRGFWVLHQKLEFEIDFATRSLRGKTEITIQPTRRELKTIRFSCRQCTFKRLNVNGRGPTLKYQEPYARFRMHPQATVHQHHQLRQKLAPQLKEPPEEELTINIPRSVTIQELDPATASDAPNPLLSRLGSIVKNDAEDPVASATVGTPRPADEAAVRYAPITVYIEFAVESFRDGLHFVGLEDGDQRYPHVYTRNSFPSGVSCCWFPHVHEVSSRHTWDISVRHLRTLRDVLRHCQGGLNAAREALSAAEPMEGDRPPTIQDSNWSLGKSSDDLARPFEFVDLSEFRETAEDDKLGHTAVRLHAYCLPLRAEELKNTCIPIAKWIGVDIIPREPTDTWLIVGIAHYITETFMKKLFGNNDYRFRQKQAADRVCEMDVGRPSLSSLGALLDQDPSEMEFMALKACLVLCILDRRLMKASGSSGLARIVSRIFLNAKVGELANGCLTTAHFHRTSEKLGHTKLDLFFQQWVYGAGCPRFLVTQRFNKKKLVVEMFIRQVQAELQMSRDLDVDHFMRDVKRERDKIKPEPVQPIFTGPMTIRIHEADGTPYEHIVEIREASTKFEIPYNTKYKRLKRSRRQKERAATAAGIDITVEAQDDVLLYCLGDVLQSEEEVRSWRLADWSKDDEDKMSQESYEWIRMDADFEWICKMTIAMPGYMYLSQLQQDRDVVAQYEYIASQNETALVSTILVRTLMDRRYFHGIRTAAAHALAKCAKDELDWIGLFHLEKAFRELFCFPDSPMTRSNDFTDRRAYYVQCAIPFAMAKVRDYHGRSPMRVQRFLYDVLNYNDNTNNPYSDNHYVAVLMNALCDSILPDGRGRVSSGDDRDEDDEQARFREAAVAEIDRYRLIDEWIPSYQNLYTTTALDCKRRLAKARVVPVVFPDFLLYTRPGNYDEIRVNAFENLIQLGILRQDSLLDYLLLVLGLDASPFVRDRLRRSFVKGLAAIGVGEGTSMGNAMVQEHDGLIIEQEASSTVARQAELARKQTVAGALAALKEEIGANETLQKALWEAVISPTIGLLEMRDLLDVCSILYEPKTSLVVKLTYPRYWRIENLGNGRLRFFHSERFRLTTMPPSLAAEPTAIPSTVAVAASGAPAKRDRSKKAKKDEDAVPSPARPPLPKLTLKHKRQPPATAGADAASAASPSEPEPKRPRLKLTLKKPGPE